MTQNQTDGTGRHSLDPKHAPVTIPAGSFDAEKLTKGLNHATTLTAEHRADAVEKALDKALPSGDAALGARERIAGQDPSDQDGFKRVDVEHDEIEGLVENKRVFDPKHPDEPAAEPVTKPAATRGAAKGE